MFLFMSTSFFISFPLIQPWIFHLSCFLFQTVNSLCTCAHITWLKFMHTLWFCLFCCCCCQKCCFCFLYFRQTTSNYCAWRITINYVNKISFTQMRMCEKLSQNGFPHKSMMPCSMRVLYICCDDGNKILFSIQIKF
jgi:hypothetical protein